MSLFAHEGVEHATAVEAANHEAGSGQWAVILAVTAVVVLAVAVVIYLLRASEPRNSDSTKSKSTKKEKL